MQRASSLHLVALHGWTLDPTVRERWQPFLKLLEQKGLTVHFWPLPGLAVSADQAFTLEDYVAWLTKKTQSLESFILLGHSFGGQLATRFAKLHPEKVSRLILIDSSGILDSSLRQTLKRLVFKALAKTGRTLTQSPALRKLLYQFARETDYYQANAAQRQTMQHILADEVKNDLPDIATPTLVIWGRRDRMTPLHLGKIFAAKIPNAKLAVISEARHSPIYTQPDQVASLIADFLKA